MASINLIEAFQEFKDAENIDRPTLMKVVEDVFKTCFAKNLAVTKILTLSLTQKKVILKLFAAG